MITIKETPEDKLKVFTIDGWTDKPLLRIGTKWVALSGQTRAFYAAIQGLDVGESKHLPFKTASGEIPYKVTRTR